MPSSSHFYRADPPPPPTPTPTPPPPQVPHTHHLQVLDSPSMRRPSHLLPGYRTRRFPSRPKRFQWFHLLRLTTLLALLALLCAFLLHASSFALSRANSLGRMCLPPPEPLPEVSSSSTPLRIAMVSLSDEGTGVEVESGSEIEATPESRVRQRSFEGLMGIVRSNKEAYARAWGYDFVDARGSIDRSRPPSWSKIRAIRRHLPDYDWVFWNDADSLVTNPNISLEGILRFAIGRSDLVDSPDLVVTEDVNGINAGMFFVRRSAWSERFLDAWWNLTSFVQFGSTRSGDNFALIHLVASLPPEERREHVRVAPRQCLFNSYVWDPSWKSLVRLVTHPWTAWNGAHSRGDFMVHLAGLDDKKGWAAEILREMDQ